MARKTTTSTTKKSSARKTTAAPPKPGKPIFGIGTWVALVLLAALIGGAYYLNNKKETTEAEATPVFEEISYVFAEDSFVTSIEVKPADGETVKVARNEENVWAIELPFETEADQGLAEAAASQITALEIIDELDANVNPSIFGFDEPAYVITIEFEGGKKQVLEIGDSTPTNSGYYVRLDEKKMMIVGLSGIDALTNLVFFPPYLNTPTPTALPTTPTAEPPTQAVTTPEATPTP
ncbi:MAG: DUF4340 domain-containing protein [Chloroflexi bacterium]|nr:DUF4340 domain-containing protein [Chloroflexota bacterium]